MVDIIKLILTLSYIYVIGFLVVIILQKNQHNKISLFCLIGLGGIFGLGFISVELFLFYLIKIPWELSLLAIPWVFIFGFLLIKKRGFIKIIQSSLSDYLIIIAILALTFLTIGWALTHPIGYFDAWSIWNFKAQVFFLRRTIPLDFLNNPALPFIRSNYPNLLPLSQTWIYLHLGKIQTGYAQIVYLITYSSMLLICLDFFKSVSKNKFLPLILTLLLALTPFLIEHSQSNMADVILAVYILSGLAYLIRWIREDQKFYLFFSTISFGFAAFTKEEGVVIYCLFILFLYFYMIFIQKKSLPKVIRETIIPIALSIFIWSIWIVFSKIHALKNAMPSKNINLQYTIANFRTNLSIIFKAAINQVGLNYPRFGSLWIIFLISFFIALIAKLESVKYYLLIFLIIIAYIGIYFYSPLNLERQLLQSLSRLALQIAPSAILLSGFSILLIWDKANGKIRQ